jgi:hypothetical protein
MQLRCKACKCFDRPRLLLILLLPMFGATGVGQISVQNKTSATVPIDRAWVIYQTACQVVAEQFHVRRPTDLQVPFTLNVGSTESGVQYDSGAGRYEINLSTWSENTFAFAALRLTLQRLSSLHRGSELLTETLKRADRKLPWVASRRQ